MSVTLISQKMPVLRSATLSREPAALKSQADQSLSKAKVSTLNNNSSKLDIIWALDGSSGQTSPSGKNGNKNCKSKKAKSNKHGGSSKSGNEARPTSQQDDAKQNEDLSKGVVIESKEIKEESTLDKLVTVLQEQGCYETDKGREIRAEILSNLNKIVRDWIEGAMLSKDAPWHNAGSFGGRIVTYGSYQLGISHQGADIDALCVAPSFISRNDYFSTFFIYLSSAQGVTELRAIEEAYVPVIKFRYNGVEIDMTFAQLPLEQVPPSDTELLNNELFNHFNMDPRCLRSLNGYRSTLLILKLVPDVEKFRLVLRAVKLWAQSQGIYSNILGYLGGFSWAVLSARVCMDYPDLDAPELIAKFFHHYKAWPWPKAVSLIDHTKDDIPSFPTWDMSCFNISASWNPDKNVQERYQVMPILTPTYPHQNSTFNVSSNTLKLIREKMRVASEICDNILKGDEKWDSLFKTCHMFHEYEHFLIVVASAPFSTTSGPQNHQHGHTAPSSSQQQALQWFGLIESKIRHFVNNLEKECPKLLSARIWPKPFSKIAQKTETTKQLWFIGLEFNDVRWAHTEFDTSRPLQSFNDLLLKQSVSFFSREMKLEAHYLLKSQLTSHLSNTEIEEIVSFQSQKVRDVHFVTRSGDSSANETVVNGTSLHSTTASYVNGLGNTHGFTRGGGSSNNNNNNNNLLPPCTILPPPNQPPPSSGVQTFFNALCSTVPPPPLTPPASTGSRLLPTSSSCGQSSSSVTVSTTMNPFIAIQNYTGQRPDSPVIQRVWNSSSQGRGKYSQTSATKFNYDRAKQSQYLERADSTASSTSGLDVSYSSLDSDHGRSISYSSDKFPPQVLVNARLQHGDPVPYAQLASCPPPRSSRLGCGSGLYVTTTPAYDSSVPPPPSPILTKAPSFVGINPRPLNLSSQQRLSTTEIRDVSTPLPVQSHNYPPLRFNFNSHTIQQLQSAQDSVFT